VKEHPFESGVEKKGVEVIIPGKVTNFSTLVNYPFENLLTVSLTPRTGPVHYLKFLSMDEFDELSVNVGDKITIEGCRHIVTTRTNRPVVFNVKIKRSP